MHHVRPHAFGGGLKFKDRADAAEALVGKLQSYKGQHPLILGIPRGAVPMAKILAERLNGDMDVVLVKKIGAPGNPECAIGSVSEYGTIHRSDDAHMFPEKYIQDTAKEVLEKLHKRRQQYSPVHKALDPKGRVVIVVDDGIATGSTMLAAVRAIRQQHPKKLIIAAPVAPPDTVSLFQGEVDELVILETPPNFYAVGQFYDEFPQVEDDDVLRILAAGINKH